MNPLTSTEQILILYVATGLAFTFYLLPDIVQNLRSAVNKSPAFGFGTAVGTAVGAVSIWPLWVVVRFVVSPALLWWIRRGLDPETGELTEEMSARLHKYFGEKKRGLAWRKWQAELRDIEPKNKEEPR